MFFNLRILQIWKKAVLKMCYTHEWKDKSLSKCIRLKNESHNFTGLWCIVHFFFFLPGVVSLLDVPVYVRFYNPFPAGSAGPGIQGYLPRLSGNEVTQSTVNVARQHCECAERNTSVHAAMSHLCTGETWPPKALPLKWFMLGFCVSNW